ncbi:MAG: signal recognition particle-docking protein FtsY [Cyanomargarita calcarea GSE-NOS-MK-12-04C]|jgi:fused signal recognition particle receptor|uniref:Signal recognition particle receptor FtsY n=1 Tax=Cyanomargarita calcarea GSE-NOS-MK-12-04C TaxID=2839659 RepID=A0A951USI0_9CYAN|nr:signal recognition particle-docking protein FtsY [Cyanomargarita calcarea GSE-NOS-MK-12-04C]
MVFNWFRRQYNDSSNKPSEEKQAQTPAVEESPPETDTTSTPSEKTSPDTQADLLAFAKAAYKNIQQKQQTEEAEISPADVETVETVAETIETTPPEETVETVAEIITEESSSRDGEPVATPTLSFLERAAKERQTRQERLIATAIEVPESEVMPTASTSITEEGVLGLEFDDGFVWSTKILAAQGRRAEEVSIEEINWLKKLRQGLDKTRRNILNQLKAIVGQGPLNQAAVGEIEALLLSADVGVEATDYIIEALQTKLRSEALPPDAAIAYLKRILRDILDAPMTKSYKPTFAPEKETFNIWLIVGVNGAGKTTTIGKIAHLAQKSGYKCLIGAADTFRAAAVQQVQVWGTRSGVEVIANPGKNTDPAAVVFDAIAAAVARDTEILLVDTAGRLQNKKNLMDELSKVRRIIDKKAPNAKVESLLVLDATLGQNGLRQAEVFAQAAQLTGVVLTKLDGTAKGGVALAVVKQLGLPIRFIGAGEGIEDLRPFSSYEFVEALLNG